MLLSFGECLRRVMQQRRCSIAMLQQKMGIKSATSISRVLRDECSFEVSAKFFEQLQITNLLMLNRDETDRLKQALEVKRLGASTYMAYQTLEKMFTNSDCGDHSIQVFEAAGVRYISMQDWINEMSHYTRIQVYAFNCCSALLFHALVELFQRFSSEFFLFTHYFDLTPDPLRLVDPLVCLISVLRFDGYNGFYRIHGSGSMDGIPALLSNQINLWAFEPDGKRTVYAITMTGEGRLIARKYHDDGSQLRLLEEVLKSEDFMSYLPVRRNVTQSSSHDDLISLYQRLLFMEKDREQRILWQNLCVSFIPPNILRDMALETSYYNTPEGMSFMQALTPLHTNRHRNIFDKKKNTHVVLNREAMRRFAHEGYLQEHPAGLPPIDPQKRIEILQTLLRNCKTNVFFHTYIGRESFPPDDLAYMSFAGFGLYMYDANTNYSLDHPLYEAIISIDELAKLFDSFFDDIILTKYVDSEAESIAFLSSLLHETEGLSATK